MKNLTVRRFVALSLTLLSVFFVGNSALGAGGITTVTIGDVVTMTVTKGIDFANILAADLTIGTKSVSGAWTIQVDAISNYTLDAILTLAQDNAATPVPVSADSLSIGASAQAGGTDLASTAFTAIDTPIALAATDGTLPFTGVNNAGTGGANISSIDLEIDLSKLGDRSTTVGDGDVVNYTLDFVVTEA